MNRLARQESAAPRRGIRAGSRSSRRRTGLAGLSLLLLLFPLCGHGCTSGESRSPVVTSPGVSPSSRAAPPATRRRGDNALALACAYLWSKQAPDGGWRSDAYAYLRSGQALTPFILHALFRVDPEAVSFPTAAARRALDWIRAGIDDERALGLADPDLVEYPNHSTAFAVECLVDADRRGLGAPGDRQLIERLRRYLTSEQYRPENGFDASSSVHGGWGFGGFRPKGSPGHLDVSYTRHVLEALRAAEDLSPAPPEVFQRAERFLRFVQKHPSDRRPQPPDYHPDQPGMNRHVFDGGFYFSPVVGSANKGGLQDVEGGNGTVRVYRSYATATCDGLLALLAAGVPVEDARVESARRWFETHPRVDYPEGIPADEPNGWADAVHFYHLAVRAEAYAALGWPGEWRDGIARALAPLQRDDGSFRNDRNSLMKEDDPLVATALAVVALGR